MLKLQVNGDESIWMMRAGLDALTRVFPDCRTDYGDSDGNMGGEPSQGNHP